MPIRSVKASLAIRSRDVTDARYHRCPWSADHIRVTDADLDHADLDRATRARADAETAVREALAAAGSAATPLHLLHEGATWVFAAPDLGVAARVATNQRALSGQRAAVAVSARLAERGMPVPHPMTPPGSANPTVVRGRIVTFWNLLPQTRPAEFADVAQVLDLLDHTDTNDLDVPTWTPSRIFDCVDAVTSRLPGKFSDLLRAERERLAHRAALLDPADLVFTHGDLHLGNVLVSDGGAHLLDWETACRAPRGWELASTLMAVRRFGAPSGVYRDLAARVCPDLPVTEQVLFARLKELSATCWLTGRYGTDIELDREVLHRVASLASPPTVRWTRWT